MKKNIDPNARKKILIKNINAILECNQSMTDIQHEILQIFGMLVFLTENGFCQTENILKILKIFYEADVSIDEGGDPNAIYESLLEKIDKALLRNVLKELQTA